MQDPNRAAAPDRATEWPSILLIIATYALWIAGTTALYSLSPLLGIAVSALTIVQYASIQHEVLHDHPFRRQWLNEALVFPALTLTVPYGRFRATHLAHHHDPDLTDPYDDPESNYCDPLIWASLAPWQQKVLRMNNTLLGRMVLGPVLGNFLWLKNEAVLLLARKPGVLRDWLLHCGGLVVLGLWLKAAAMPLWAYLVAAYFAHSILKIRTFLEHRAHEVHRARSVIVEDKGPLALLFLNNNLHAVHHIHPQVPWYRLPGLYRANQAQYLRRNEGYRYDSYLTVLKAYFLTAKDPVPHPLMPVSQAMAQPAAADLTERDQTAA